MRRTLAALMAAGLLVGAGCGGDDDEEGADGGGGGGTGSTEEFCDAYTNDFNDLTTAGSPEEVEELLGDINPPAEIADDWQTMTEGIQAGDPSDPEFTEAAAAIGMFVAQECDLGELDLPEGSDLSVPEGTP